MIGSWCDFRIPEVYADANQEIYAVNDLLKCQFYVLYSKCPIALMMPYSDKNLIATVKPDRLGSIKISGLEKSRFGSKPDHTEQF